MRTGERKGENPGTIAALSAKVPAGATLSCALDDETDILVLGGRNGHSKTSSEGSLKDHGDFRTTKNLGALSTQKVLSSAQGQNARDRALQSIAKRNRQCSHYVQKELEIGSRNSFFVDDERLSPGGAQQAKKFSGNALSLLAVPSSPGLSNSSFFESNMDDTQASLPSHDHSTIKARMDETRSGTAAKGFVPSPIEISRETQDNCPLDFFKSSNSIKSSQNKSRFAAKAAPKTGADSEGASSGRTLAVLRNENKLNSADALSLSVQRDRERKVDENSIENCPLNFFESNSPIKFTQNKSHVVENVSPRVSTDQEGTSCRKPLAALRNKNKIKSPDALPLSVQREKERQTDVDLTKGQNSNETRRNLDKRSARLKYSEYFKQDIRRFTKSQSLQQRSVLTSALSTDAPSSVHDIYSSEEVVAAGGVAVFVRKRPIFPYELDRKDFDVVSLASDDRNSLFSLPNGTGTRVQIQNCHMHADMRRMMIQPITFSSTLTFDETCSNEFVYDTVGYPLVQNVVNYGSISTILMFGQTGSGKTYTMSSIELHAAQDVFAAIEENTKETEGTGEHCYNVTIQFIELAGKVCRDLIASSPKEKSSVKIVDDNGRTKIRNAEKKSVNSAKELSELIALGKSRRATEATDANGVSSRSHSVCQIEVKTKKDGRIHRGVLNLLDCAGTERRNDTLYHSSSRQKESTEINESLYALKACIRARTNSGSTKNHVPYRSSNLTKLLRESFERDDAKLAVIATISPNATDTEHSIETLKTVASFSEKNCFQSHEPRFVEIAMPKKNSIDISPKQMSHAQLVAWMSQKNIPHAGVGSAIDGKAFFKMTAKMLCSQCFGGNMDLADEAFKKIRNENDRISKLQRDARKAFKQNRLSMAH